MDDEVLQDEPKCQLIRLEGHSARLKSPVSYAREPTRGLARPWKDGCIDTISPSTGQDLVPHGGRCPKKEGLREREMVIADWSFGLKVIFDINI